MNLDAKTYISWFLHSHKFDDSKSESHPDECITEMIGQFGDFEVEPFGVKYHEENHGQVKVCSFVPSINEYGLAIENVVVTRVLNNTPEMLITAHFMEHPHIRVAIHRSFATRDKIRMAVFANEQWSEYNGFYSYSSAETVMRGGMDCETREQMTYYDEEAAELFQHALGKNFNDFDFMIDATYPFKWSRLGIIPNYVGLGRDTLDHQLSSYGALHFFLHGFTYDVFSDFVKTHILNPRKNEENTEFPSFFSDSIGHGRKFH